MAYEPLENVTSSLDFFTWVNGIVQGWFFAGIITAVYFITMIKMMYSTNS